MRVGNFFPMSAIVVFTAATTGGAIGAEKRAATTQVPCSIYVGESQLYEGLCLTTSRPNNRVDVAEKNPAGYKFSFRLHGDKDTVFWNGERTRKPAKSKLGEAQWLEGCWQSVAGSAPHFSVCLSPPKQP